LKNRVDHLESLVNFLANLGSRENNLAADEDEKNNLRLDHAVDETREELGFIRREIVVTRSKTFKTDGELDIARANNVLDFEVGKFGIESELLDDTSVLARS
jgi:hypothetical protein